MSSAAPWIHFRVLTSKSTRGRFLVLAKTEPFINGDVVREPGDVWFEWGETISEAMDKLRMEIGRARPVVMPPLDTDCPINGTRAVAWGSIVFFGVLMIATLAVMFLQQGK